MKKYIQEAVDYLKNKGFDDQEVTEELEQVETK